VDEHEPPEGSCGHGQRQQDCPPTPTEHADSLPDPAGRPRAEERDASTARGRAMSSTGGHRMAGDR
jgi:hypothetical protein